MGTVIALLIILLALAMRAAAVQARRKAHAARTDSAAASAGAALVAEVRKMVTACEALTALEPAAGASCKLLSRGISCGGTRDGSSDSVVALYQGLASPTELTAAAVAYDRAALAASGPLAAALAACGAQLRAIVAGIHRLGAALDLE